MNRLPPCSERDDVSLEGELAALFQRIDYEKVPPPNHANPQKLEGMHRLVRALALESPRFQVVHVAGTKGKGTVGRQIALALQYAGRRVGRYSSPHIERLNERIEVNGAPIADPDLARALRTVRIASQKDEANGAAPHSFFEVVTAAALLHFRDADCDFVVLEVGLGGRLDSTNVCQPALCVITNISIDHTRQLGNTVAQIASEKAGIVKPRVPVVSGATDAEAASVIRQVCQDQESRLWELNRDFIRADVSMQASAGTTTFSIKPPAFDCGKPQSGEAMSEKAMPFAWPIANISARGLGEHVSANGAVVVATLRALDPEAAWITDDAIRAALAAPPLPGRFEVLARRPTVVLDMAHNEASIAGMVQALDYLMEGRQHGTSRLVFSVCKDKDRRKLLDLLVGRFDEIHLTQFATNPRAVPIEDLEVTAREAIVASHRQVLIRTWADPTSAWEAAWEDSRPDDLLCVAGSAFLIGELRPLAGQAVRQLADRAGLE